MTLAELREDAGLSLREAAVESGFSASHILNVEHGRKCPSEALLDALAVVYGVDGDELCSAFGVLGHVAAGQLQSSPALVMKLRAWSVLGAEERDVAVGKWVW